MTHFISLNLLDDSIPSISSEGKSPLPNGSRVYTVSIKGTETSIRGPEETISAIREALNLVPRKTTRVIRFPLSESVHRMASRAGLSMEPFEDKKAMSLTPTLAIVLTSLESNPDRFSSDLGEYYLTWSWLKALMRATVDHPEAVIRLSM